MTGSSVSWPLLGGLSADERRELLTLAQRRSFSRSDVLCNAGDPADSLHLVASGRLAVHVSLESGETSMINLLGAGDYFGELALMGVTGRRTATITALEKAETLVISARAFARLRDAKPEFERTLSALLGHRVDKLSQRLLEAMYVGLDRRLHRRLLELSEEYGIAGGHARIPLTQSQLANLVGGTRQSVNQALQRLADSGVVAVLRGQVDVDVPRLQALLDH